jgi:hypothetical protein
MAPPISRATTEKGFVEWVEYLQRECHQLNLDEASSAAVMLKSAATVVLPRLAAEDLEHVLALSTAFVDGQGRRCRRMRRRGNVQAGAGTAVAAVAGAAARFSVALLIVGVVVVALGLLYALLGALGAGEAGEWRSDVLPAMDAVRDAIAKELAARDRPGTYRSSSPPASTGVRVASTLPSESPAAEEPAEESPARKQRKR